MRNKRKLLASVSAAVLTAAIVLSSTFAWQSINQTAKNEVSSEGINPGGRLHDDFDGETKKVYVENFGEENIFARIRLDEYMELGDGAGEEGTNRGDGTQLTILGNPTAQFADPSTWMTHKPNPEVEDCNVAEPGFHDYFKWTMGGKTWYMPTFDKNKDSLDADINGTLAGGDTGTAYGDYIEYGPGDKETGNAIYDADDNTVQDGNTTSQREEHTAAETLDATVITMQEWIDGGRTPGNYWVYDVDGWAYWAQPIQPGTATGLLLASIEQIAEPDKDWYYSINVVAQFATAGDWGNQEEGTGFYDESKGAAPSKNAETLLNQIAGLMDITITTDSGNVTTVEPGATVTFTATAKIAGTDEVLAGKKFEWSVSGGESTIDKDTGVLTVSENDDLKHLLIKATIQGSENFGTYRVQVVDPDTPVVTPDDGAP